MRFVATHQPELEVLAGVDSICSARWTSFGSASRHGGSANCLPQGSVAAAARPGCTRRRSSPSSSSFSRRDTRRSRGCTRSRSICVRSFPPLLSSPRFVARLPRHFVPLAVCHPARIQQHRVCAVDARRGKTSMGGSPASSCTSSSTSGASCLRCAASLAIPTIAVRYCDWRATSSGGRPGRYLRAAR
jgi:hypothetical protein